MVKQLFRYGKLIAPRVALAFGAFAVMLSSQVMAEHITPGACAPACATPPACCAPECATPCAPTCETPVTCAPACEAPATCAPACEAPATCAPECTDNACGEEEEGCEGLSGLGLFGDSGITIGGWTQIGYHTEANGLFNNHPDQVNLHQQWLYIEKIADGSKGLDWGFRADVIYGVDAQDTQAFGNNPGVYDEGWDHGDYGWAIPQLYSEVAVGDLSVKLGHFYTIAGYEVVQAPGNFFYSHAYTMYNSEPFTHTGALATYKASDDVTLYGGYTLGWDTGFDQNNGGSNFLGGFTIALSEMTSFTYTNTIGDLGLRGDSGYTHSIVVTNQLSDSLKQVLVSDYTSSNNIGQTGFQDDTYSLANYLLYDINDNLAAGIRTEWWRVNTGPLDDSVYEITAGLNIKPIDNVVFRPEIRHDWNNPFVADDSFTTFGIDAIWTY